MALYSYIAFNRNGKEKKGVIDANSLNSAKSKLKSLGLYVKYIEIDKKHRKGSITTLFSKFNQRISRRDVGLFIKQLSFLLGAGLPLDQALKNIIEQVENENFAKILVEIRADVTEGDSLSKAIKKHPEVFTNQYPSLISVGERTGQYEATLDRLAELEEKSSNLKSKVQVAMIYPLIMGLLSLFVTIFLLTVVIPQIQELFLQFDAKLPLITRIVIGLSNLIVNYWWLLLLIVSGLFYSFIRFKSTPKGKLLLDRYMIRMPLLGNMKKKVMISDFARNLNILLNNGVPLVTSLQIVSSIIENSIFEDELKKSIDRLKEGDSLSNALKDSSILPVMVTSMIAAGEKSDKIPQMMEKLSQIYDDEIDNVIKSLTQSLEPIMIIIMGGLIFTIMAAIMTPMYQLTQQLQKL